VRRITRIAAAAALAAGMAAATPTAAPAAGPPTGGPGWNLIATYPTKGECLAVGQAGVPERWDAFRCEPHIEPLSAGGTSQTDGWDLLAVVYVR
jgi:hypothetical protein